MGLKRLPIFVRWALFAVAIYVPSVVFRAVVEAYPTRQADIQFDPEFLFWIWIIPTGLHYAVIGIWRLLTAVEARRPLPGASSEELAWKAFSRPSDATQERDTPEPPFT